MCLEKCDSPLKISFTFRRITIIILLLIPVSDYSKVVPNIPKLTKILSISTLTETQVF